MCGIFAYAGEKINAASIVFEGLKHLEYRGYDSWGVAVVPVADTNKQIFVKKRIGKIGNATVVDMPESMFAFGHTRWATHGGVTQANAHPHLDCTGTIAVIHNGIFENYENVKNKLIQKSHTFISETDTEVIAHLIEEYAKSMDFGHAVQKVFNEMKGLNAIIAFSQEDNKFIAARNGSPLVVGYGKDENFLASDATALLSHTKLVHYLEDNEMAILNKNDIRLFNVKTGEPIKPKKQRLTWNAKEVEKGDYEYFMLKEIYEQPRVIADIAASDSGQVQKIADFIKKTENIYMVGCGTASYAGIAGEYLFSKIAKRHVNVSIGSEFGYDLDFLTKKSLVVAISQSGETMDVLESVKKAKARGATILALVNVLGSTLYREADKKILIGAGPEIGVASTKAFIGMLAHLVLLAYALIDKMDEGIKTLTMAVKSTESILTDANVKRLMLLVKKLKTKNHIFVIGRGLSYPTALETALKIKEISYIHAEGLAAGELKHGTLALVTQGTPCIVFLPNDETYSANLAAAMEMKARGGYIVGISNKSNDVFDDFIKVDDAGEATIIPNVVVAQLLAYYLTVERGFDPDMPRNLAKSVTVK